MYRNKRLDSVNYLVLAGESSGDTRAATKGKAAQADVARVKVRICARTADGRVARAVVAAGGTHRDELYLTEESGLSADRRGGSRVREDVRATHIT